MYSLRTTICKMLIQRSNITIVCAMRCVQSGHVNKTISNQVISKWRPTFYTIANSWF